MPAFGAQPRAVNRAHPLLRNCVGWWYAPAGRQGGPSLLNLLAPGTQPAALQSGVAWAPSPLGPVVQCSGSGSNSYIYGPGSQLAFGAGDFTVVVACYVKSTGSTQTIFDTQALAGNPVRSDCFAIDMVSGALRPFNNNVSLTASTLTLNVGWNLWAFRRTGTTAGYWINGQADAAAPTLSASLVVGNLFLGAPENATNVQQFTGAYQYAAGWSRYLPDTELSSLWADWKAGHPALLPWLQRAVPFGAVTGTGAGSLKSLTGSGAGTLAAYATGAGTLRSVTGAGVGSLAAYATGAGTLGRVTGAGVGVLTSFAAGAGTLGRVVGTGTGGLSLIHGDGITVAYQSSDGSDPFGSLDDDPGQVVGIN